MRASTLVLGLTFSALGSGQSFRIDTFAGSGNIGDGGQASAALLQAVQGVARDQTGNLYIADADDHRVRMVTPAGIIQTIAGIGIAGFQGDGGRADTAQLNTPYGVAADRSGNLYIADFHNGRIRKVSKDGEISTFAGGGSRQPGGDSDGGPATEVALRAPRNVAVDLEGNVYFSDFVGHRVYRVGAYGTLITVAGTGGAGLRGDGGPADRAELSYPAGLAVDPAGVLYIADSGNKRIRRVARGIVSTLGGPGGPLLFGAPSGLSMDAAGNLYVADPQFGQVLKVAVSTSGGVSEVAPEGRDVSADPAGTVYIAAANRVRKVSPDGSWSIVVGNSQLDRSGDQGPAAAAGLGRPGAIAFDMKGNLLIADRSANRVRVVSPSGVISTLSSNLSAPQGVAADLYGNIFISDTGNGIVRRVLGTAWSVTAGKPDVKAPGPLATDEYGNLYVSDLEGHRVIRVSPSGLVSPFAGTGQRGNRGDGGLATLAQLDTPRGLAVDREGSLYIADSGNSRVRKVSREGIITTVASGLGSPDGVASSASGTLVVSEGGAHALRIISGQSLTVIAGTGKTGFSGDGGPARAAELNLPSGITFDSIGNLYVADSGNRRIRKLTPAAAEPPPPPRTITGANAASFVAAPVAPGEIISLLGSDIGPQAATGAKLGANGTLEMEVAGTSVQFDGIPAPLLHASANQINLIVPYGVAAKTSVEVTIVYGGSIKARLNLPVAEAAPGMFTVSSGTGQVIAVHTDGSLNSRMNPVPRGAIITMYATGEGLRTPAAIDGKPADALARPVLPVSMRIAGYEAEILYAGAAPGFAGLMQINARVPAGFAPTGEQPVSLKVGTVESQPGVNLWIR